ncbi:MAG TPA: hypothetical protein VMW01_07355 [Williamwhitmania sp.]|jgi:hypothetical protein|nr:hypothetical protein [Williamwhitmania sp.]
MEVSSKQNIQTYGYITKQEQLTTEAAFASYDSLILSVTKPFPGYEGSNALDSKPTYVYLGVDQPSTDNSEHIFRITKSLRQTYHREFDACPGRLTLYNKFQSAIRVMLSEESSVADIISLFNLYGVTFSKNQPIAPYISMVNVYKFFELKNIADGLWTSNKNLDCKYFHISKFLKWPDFEKIVMEVKQTPGFSNFDFAQAAMHSRYGLDDFIRVYSKETTIEHLQELRALVQRTIDKYTI